MKKLTALIIAILVVSVWAGANACGDENSSAKKVDASKADAKTTQASVKVTDANVRTMESGENMASKCSSAKQAKVETANAKMIDGSSCDYSGKAKAMTADSKSQSSACPVSKDCPAGGKSCSKAMKAKTADSGASSGSVAMAPKAEESDK